MMMMMISALSRPTVRDSLYSVCAEIFVKS